MSQILEGLLTLAGVLLVMGMSFWFGYLRGYDDGQT